MNIEIIRSKYPKAFAQMRIWGNKALTQVAGLPESIADIFPDEMLLPSLVNSRALMDFFDGYDINVCPIRLGGGNWKLSMSRDAPIGDYPNRRSAEEAGFSEAFKELEKLLS